MQLIEAQIQACGQVPSQLLIEPHPPRSSAMHLVRTSSQPFAYLATNHTQSAAQAPHASAARLLKCKAEANTLIFPRLIPS